MLIDVGPKKQENGGEISIGTPAETLASNTIAVFKRKDEGWNS
jgi:hypothetical protein